MGGGRSRPSGSFATLRMTAETYNGNCNCNGNSNCNCNYNDNGNSNCDSGKALWPTENCHPTHRKLRDGWGTRAFVANSSPGNSNDMRSGVMWGGRGWLPS